MQKNSTVILAEVQRLLSGHPPALQTVMDHLMGAAGKCLRGRLVLICSGASGGEITSRKAKAHREKAVSLAAAIEVLHLATLVHDDIIDEADVRRGIPSIQAQFGRRTAVIGGDYLFTICFQAVANQNKEHIQEFARAMSGICRGELMQHQYRNTGHMSFMRYIRIIAHKTGVLFACAAVAGAGISGLDRRHVSDLGRYAGYLGILFQIVDDCLDFSSSDTTLKSARKDIAMGVVTLPMIFTFQQQPNLAEIMSNGDITEEQVDEIVAAVRECGGLEKAMEVAKRYHQRAVYRLNRLPDFLEKDELYKLLDRALHREK